jgi:hypothetical protein
MRHRERLQHGTVSPTLRRVPSTPLPSLLSLAPPPQVSAPVIYNEQSFSHLPAHLAAALQTLPPLPTSSRRRQAVHPSFPPSSPPQILAPAAMSATLLPSQSSPPPPPRPATSPPISPQRHQHAIRHQERLQRGTVSPTLRRVPSTHLPSLLSLAPPPQVSAPVTFNERTYNHLPANLAASVGRLQPLFRGRPAAHPLPVSYLLFFFYIMLNISFNRSPLLLLLVLVLALALCFPLLFLCEL